MPATVTLATFTSHFVKGRLGPSLAAVRGHGQACLCPAPGQFDCCRRQGVGDLGWPALTAQARPCLLPPLGYLTGPISSTAAVTRSWAAGHRDAAGNESGRAARAGAPSCGDGRWRWKPEKSNPSASSCPVLCTMRVLAATHAPQRLTLGRADFAAEVIRALVRDWRWGETMIGMCL
jgi:hypothetical protein